MSGAGGLTAVPLPDLRMLLTVVETNRTAVPLTEVGLQSVNLGHLAGRLGSLDGLDRAGVLAALSIALAERERAGEWSAEVVWTGPEARGSTSRDTAVVVRRIFSAARRSVLVAGYAFDHGRDILRPLHVAMRDRGVTVDLFLDLRERAAVGTDLGAFASEKIDLFIEQNWPFGEPTPNLYYAPATLAPESAASLHAKCVVVDEETTLVTSANFTDRGQSRNIEIGILLHDRVLASQIVAQWKGALAAGQFVQWS
ncbi:MAG: DISARM system phospholipase D-like protein DrmC [Deltaproteobacteria bacterium]|nr:DISARM system phospholipase D-like protein DrmC [Deltaproteobacteria bacterium]